MTSGLLGAPFCPTKRHILLQETPREVRRVSSETMAVTPPLRPALLGRAFIQRRAAIATEAYWWGFVLFMCSTPFPFVFQPNLDPNNPFSLLQEKSLYIYFKMAVVLPAFWRAWLQREKLYKFA